MAVQSLLISCVGQRGHFPSLVVVIKLTKSRLLNCHIMALFLRWGISALECRKGIHSLRTDLNWPSGECPKALAKKEPPSPTSLAQGHPPNLIQARYMNIKISKLGELW